MKSFELKGGLQFDNIYNYVINYILDAKTTTEKNKILNAYVRSGRLGNIVNYYNAPVANFIEFDTVDEAYSLYNYQDRHKKFIKPQAKVSKGNKVFFCDSSFPSLLLGRLDTDVKRTTNVKNADIIVSDCNVGLYNCFKQLYLMDIKKQKLLGEVTPDYNETLGKFKARIAAIITEFNSLLGVDLKLYGTIAPDNYETYQLYNSNSSKFIKTSDFAKYVISQLPKLQEDECNNICYMLKAVDKATISTALGTLQYYNFFDCGIELISALTSSKHNDLPTNREAEYIYYLLGLNKNEIISAKSYDIKRKINFYMDALNNFIITPTMSVKEKVYTALRSNLFDKISEEYKEEFERLKLTLFLKANDENGETTASSSEMEGE